MPFDVVLLILRIAIALILYLFLGVLFVYIWRDLRATETLSAGTTGGAHLRVVETPDSSLTVGQVFPLQALSTLGRSPTSTIVLIDTFASTEHARVAERRGRWWLEDLDSRNGTTLNDLPVHEAVVLSTGDLIRIGQVVLRFESG